MSSYRPCRFPLHFATEGDPPCDGEINRFEFCSVHWTLMNKKHRSTAARIEAMKLGTSLGPGLLVWADTCKRRCRCLTCGQWITAGQSRLVVHTFKPNSGAGDRFRGNYRRNFAHLDCFWEALGTGCISCVDAQAEVAKAQLIEAFGFAAP